LAALEVAFTARGATLRARAAVFTAGLAMLLMTGRRTPQDLPGSSTEPTRDDIGGGTDRGVTEQTLG